MTGKMVMKWIPTKVIPLTARNYPGFQMVPAIENVPYHNVQGISSLESFSKKSTFNFIKKHGINYVFLTLTNEWISVLHEQYNRTINNGHIQIPFNKEKL